MDDPGEDPQARRERILTARYALARHVIANDLHTLKPRPVYDRPATVPDDRKAWEHLLAVKRKGRKAPQESRLIAQELGEWLHSVAAVEAKNSHRLRELVGHARVLQEIADPATRDDYQTLQQLARVEYGVRLKDAPEDPLELEAWCARACRKHDVVPSWLLSRDGPSDFDPSAPENRRHPSEVEDDDDGDEEEGKWL